MNPPAAHPPELSPQAGGCPVMHDFSMLDSEFTADP